jgi:hypothetical protein
MELAWGVTGVAILVSSGRVFSSDNMSEMELEFWGSRAEQVDTNVQIKVV